MHTDDILMLCFWGLCSLVGVVAGIGKIIDATDKEEVAYGIIVIVASLSPGIMILGGILVLIGFMWCIIELPTRLIMWIKRKRP